MSKSILNVPTTSCSHWHHLPKIGHHCVNFTTSTCDLTPTTLSPPTIQTGHGWWCQLMGRWVSWPIKGGSATSIFWKSGTVRRPRSLLNPDELTLLKLPHSVGQPIWSSIQWTINPRSMDRLKSFKQCRSALAKAWPGSVEIIPWGRGSLSARVQIRPAQFFPFH